VYYENQCDTIKADQMYEHRIKKWHKNKYHEEPILDISCERNKTTIKYNTQFLNCQIEISECPLSLDGYTENGLQIKATLCRVFSREDGDDNNEVLKVLKQIETKIYDDSNYVRKRADEEMQELCAIEYAMDHR
jgi:hypothetical protein